MLGNNNWTRLWIIPLLAFSVLCITGCNGCRNDTKTVAEKKKQLEDEKKKKQKKPDFENRMPVLLPAIFPKIEKEEDPDDKPDSVRRESLVLEAIKRNRTKLGHWATAYFQLVANNFNSKGELTALSVDVNGNPVPVLSTDYFINTTRPASLAKGVWKSLEASVYVPRRDIQASTAKIDYLFNNSTTGLTMIPHRQQTTLMKPFQYHIVLLSNRSDAYTYLNLLDSVSIPEDVDYDPVPNFYFIVPTRRDYPVPLPRHALNWTTIAYVVWDDMTPDQLDSDQQTALIDWIHQGGQLILSGPDCLDKLQTSFLHEYLPAQFDSTFNLSNADFEAINEHWSVPAKNPSEKRTLHISQTAPLVGVKFKTNPESTFIDNTGEMAIERRVGRGRIVATAFSLDDQVIRKWRSFNSFFNGCLLRRPSRKFGETSEGSKSHEWAGDNTFLFDSLVGTKLRYLSRDLSLGGTPESGEINVLDPQEVSRYYGGSPVFSSQSPGSSFRLKGRRTPWSRDLDNVWQYGGYKDDRQSGTAGWNDNSAVSIAARETLKQAAGISPPSSDFVLKMLAVYLFVLVPLNWGVFRMMGKVEWAWIAAPIIAIAGAFLVVKLASLDIGFVRSNTQIGLLECFEGYERAHVAEYSALYTSLSTRYDLKLDNGSAQSLPFAANLGKRFKPNEMLSQVTLNRSRENKLEGFQVQSNSTGMLHTEYTLDLGGRLTLKQNDDGKYLLANTTILDIGDAGVIYRDSGGDYFVCKIEQLASGEVSDPIEFEPVNKGSIKTPWLDNPLFVSAHRKARKIWTNNGGNLQPEFTLEQIGQFPKMENRLKEFSKIVMRQNPGLGPQDVWYKTINFDEFNAILRRLETESRIDVGRIFDVVIDNLELEKGEMRLIGQTNQALGKTRFEPASTQVDRQTLIVVHLKKGELPAARRDVNAFADLTLRKSNLDFYDEEDDEK